MRESGGWGGEQSLTSAARCMCTYVYMCCPVPRLRLPPNYMPSSVGQALWVPKGSEVKWDFLVSKVS